MINYTHYLCAKSVSLSPLKLQYSLSIVIQYVQSLLAPFNLETRDIPEPEMSYLSLT